MDTNYSFASFPEKTIGLLFDDSDHESYPLRYYNVINALGLLPSEDYSYFVFVYQGVASVSFNTGLTANLVKDTYFSHHGLFALTGEFKAVVIEVIPDLRSAKYKAQTLIGGVVEKIGRLKYIDGCTDSLLIPPVKKGDPCLNHLHFPEGITQTPHTHPTHRLGVVIRGKGECVTPFGCLPLVEGCIFLIKEYDGKSYAQGLDGLMYEKGTHKFNTTSKYLDVIAFHPDSDFGAEDDFHPMINRTIVNGVSARECESIRTK